MSPVKVFLPFVTALSSLRASVVLRGVCFLLCVSTSMVLESGFPVPSAGSLAALQEQNTKYAKTCVRAIAVLLKHVFCTKLTEFKNKWFGTHRIFDHVFVVRD